jgi:MYXO-CTERM domain-containing protein
MMQWVMRRSAHHAALLLVVLVAGAPAAAAPTVDLPYVSTAPDITAGEPWYQGHELFTFTAAYVLGDNSVAVSGVWHESALFLSAAVSDQDLYATASLPRDSALTWENDTIELLFDPGLKGGATIATGDPAFRQYIFTIAATLFDANGCCSAADTSWNGTATFTVTLDGTLNGAGTGYRLEMRIPWADLGLTPETGLELGLDVANDDRDDFGQASPVIEADWAGLVDSFAQPNQWGRLRLTGGPAHDGGADDGGPGDAGGSDGGGIVGPTGPGYATPSEGCGCHAAAPGGAAGLGLLALLLGLGRRRRA